MYMIQGIPGVCSIPLIVEDLIYRKGGSWPLND